MICDWPSSDRAVVQLGVEGHRLGRDRHDLPRTASTRFDCAHRLLEVAPSTSVSAAISRLPKAWPPKCVVVVRCPPGSGTGAGCVMAGSASASAAMQLRMSPIGGMPSSVAQLARRAAVVGHGHDRGDVAGHLLEAAQQHGQPGAAADRHDARAARAQPALVEQLDQWLVRCRYGSTSARSTRQAP